MKSAFTPTEEQQAILDHCLTGSDLVVKAYAGASKTTTLSMLSDEMHKKQKSGMYLAFNKMTAMEAKDKMADSVECLTVHALAYRNTDRKLLAKLRLPFVQANELVYRWNISPVWIVTKLAGQCEKNQKITANSILYLAKEAVRSYCNSADLLLSKTHCPRPNIGQAEVVSNLDGLKETILSVAKKYWVSMINPNSDIPITHDTYLKLYSLSDCKLNNLDYLMGDEWQDANPCTTEIFRKQTCQKIVVGDNYQQIYQFRGSINALNDDPNIKVLYLTKSFRFGDNVADLANKILIKSGAKLPLIGNGKDYPSKILNIYDCYIYRTNSGCVEKFFDLISKNGDIKVCLNIDVDDVKKFANHYFALKENKRVMRSHQMLVAFKSYDELNVYLEESKDGDLTKQIKLVDKIGKRINRISEMVVSSEEADCIITTCHKVKGLEYNNVYIGDDFTKLVDDTGNITDSDMELNLVYVGVTRAKEFINVDNIMNFFVALDEDISL